MVQKTTALKVRKYKLTAKIMLQSKYSRICYNQSTQEYVNLHVIEE